MDIARLHKTIKKKEGKVIFVTRVRNICSYYNIWMVKRFGEYHFVNRITGSIYFKAKYKFIEPDYIVLEDVDDLNYHNFAK